MELLRKFLDWFKGAKVHGEGDKEIVWEPPPRLSYPAKLTKAHFNAKCDLEGKFEFEPGPGKVLPVGDHELIINFLPLDPEIEKKTKKCKVTVHKAVPDCTWKQPNPITEGTLLNAKQLNACCINLPGGEYDYEPPSRSKLPMGEHTLKCTYTPAHEYTRNYGSVSLEVTITVVPMEIPEVIWRSASGSTEYVDDIIFGEKITPNNVLTAFCPTCEGRFVYDPEPGSEFQAGEDQNIRVTFHPSNRNRYKTVVLDRKVNVKRATPVIEWNDPVHIYYDTELGGEQLNATNDLRPNTHAIFAYDPPLGSKLPVGVNRLSCTFTPDPNIASNYIVPTAFVNITILPKKIPIIEWPEFVPMEYGEEISRDNIANARCRSYLEGDSPSTGDATFGGALTYEPKNGFILEPGSHTCKLTFIPTNTIEYDTVIIERELIIQKAKPVIIWPQPGPMLKSEKLNDLQLNASVAYSDKCSSRVRTRLSCKKLGLITYDPPVGTIFHAGTHKLTAIFTPHEKHNNNYDISMMSLDLRVVKKEPCIEWEDPPVVYVGHELSKLQLNALCTEIEGGVYTYDPPAGVKLPLGLHTLTLHYSVDPKYDSDYQGVTITRTVSVEVPRQPNMYWKSPPDIPYNTPLDQRHLCCVCDVYEGFLLYDPPKGTILEAGYKHKLRCSFTPDDELAWTTATCEVEIMVTKANPALIWETPKEFYAGMKIQPKHLVCCTEDLALADGDFTYKPGLGAVMSEGTHKLTASFKVPRGWRGRYNDVVKEIDLHVLPKIRPDVEWRNRSHILDWDCIIYGHRLTNKQLNATCGTCEGTITYDPSHGSLLNATEAIVITAKFTPKNLEKYLITKVSRTLEVKKAVPVIEWKPKLPFMYVGKPLEPHTLNAYTTTANAEKNDDIPIKGKFIYSPDVGDVLDIGNHTMTTIFEPCKEVAHNYTFASAYINFLVIKEGTLFKIPKRYTEPEVRPVYRDEKKTLTRPFEVPKGDFYFSEIETVADTDRDRRIIEARQEAAKRKAMMELEAVVESKSREASREGGQRSPQKQR